MPKFYNRRKNRVFLTLERLEDRCVPATINVANTAQLQAAIFAAGNFDVILMQPGVYSVGSALNANLLGVNLTIKAANANTVAIDGGGGLLYCAQGSTTTPEPSRTCGCLPAM